MLKRYLRKPNLKTLKYKFSSLSNATEIALNCKIGDHLSISEKFNAITNFSACVENLYSINDNVYAFTSDGTVLKYNTQARELVTISTAITGVPLIEEIVIGGQNKTLIISPDGAKVDSQSFSLPYGKYSAIYKGRCFTAQNNTVSFCAPFRFSDYSFDELSGAFNTEQVDGEITGLCCMGEYLYIFCQRAIYKLILDDLSIFIVNRLSVTVGEIKHGSVKCVGGKILFVSGRKILSFNGNETSVVDERMEKLCLTIEEGASVCQGKYALNVKVEGCCAQYVYDSLDKSVQIIALWTDVCADDGYTVDQSGKLYKAFFKEGSTQGQMLWQSKPQGFSSGYKKSLLEISASVNGFCRLEVTGDFGSKQYVLSDVTSVVRLNCESRSFTFKLLASQECEFGDLCVKYRIIGE